MTKTTIKTYLLIYLYIFCKLINIFFMNYDDLGSSGNYLKKVTYDILEP